MTASTTNTADAPRHERNDAGNQAALSVGVTLRAGWW
jgi:hypothetical protein